jgi:hypothetical protein
MYPIAITTAPRTTSYLVESIKSYGAPWVEIFAEPPFHAPDRLERGRYFINETKLGIVENTIHALKTLRQIYPESPWYILMEDDVEFVEGGFVKFIAFLDQIKLIPVLDKTIGMVSPYCSIHNAPALRDETLKDKQGWMSPRYDRNAFGLCGALVLAFSKPCLDFLIKNEDGIRYFADGRFKDYALGEVVRRGGFNMLVHQPTLVTHIGRHSTLIPDDSPFHDHPARQAYTKPEDYDEYLKRAYSRCHGSGSCVV